MYFYQIPVLMAKVVKSRLRRTGKVTEDPNQRKLSFYLKKGDVPTTNTVKSSSKNSIIKYFSVSKTEPKTESSSTELNSEPLTIDVITNCSDVNQRGVSSKNLPESDFKCSKVELKTEVFKNETKSEPSINEICVGEVNSNFPHIGTSSIQLKDDDDNDDSDETEIPPTPITSSHLGNSYMSSRLKRSLYDKTSIARSLRKEKHKSEDYLGNVSKILKLHSETKNDIFTEVHEKTDLNIRNASQNEHGDISGRCTLTLQSNLMKINQVTETKSCTFLKNNFSESDFELPSMKCTKAEIKEPLTDITPKSVTQNVFPSNSPVKSKYTVLRTLPLTSPVKNKDTTTVPVNVNASVVEATNLEQSLSGLNIENKNDFDSDEDLGFDFDSDFSITPKKEFNRKVSVPKIDSLCFKVDNIQRQVDGLHLTLLSSSDSYTRYCMLKGFWQDSLVEVGDKISVVSDFDSSGFCEIDNNTGFIIVNNDILISSTAITSTMFCRRKSVLAERFRGWDSSNQTMLIGNVIHELFQRVVQKEPKDLKDLQIELASILQTSSYLHELYGLQLTEASIQSQTLLYLSSTLEWIKQYQSVNSTPLYQDSNGSCDEISAQVCTVRDIEDNIWCTKFGIKGKVDLTVEVTLHKRKRKEIRTMPLELKTGKCCFSEEHKGQVILYSIMMSDRLDNPDGGLLLYLSEGPKMKFIETSHNKERGLIQLRNELAYYFKHLRKESSSTCVLPEPISRPKFCEKCPYLLPCSLLGKAFEEHSARNQQWSEVTKEAIRHLSSDHVEYFATWYNMLQKEFHSQYKKRPGISFWTEGSITKEDGGSCLSNLILEGLDSEKVGNRFSHKFCKSDLTELTNVGLSVGDYVLVSSITKSQICITMGPITLMSSETVTVILDKDLYKRHKLDNQIEQFRLDLNYSTSPFDTGFRNLLKLMLNNHNSEKLRSCIIDKVEPVFKKGLKRELADKLKPFLKVLNVSQQRAVLKLLMAENYILLQGMPGTGKTATIVTLVQVLVALGFSVLLTSYTNSAVDNILLRLCKSDCKFVRLGHVDRIHSEVKNYSSDYLTRNITSVQQLSDFYNSIPVVAATCLGLNHPVFKQRTFDYCILDEASQILQTASIGPLYHCKVFVLVGDSKQLPPVTNSKEAREMGFGESLFTRLESPTCTFELNIQYRMNSEIMKLANELTYCGKLVCGSDDVATATLQLDKSNFTSFEDWKEPVFSCKLLHSVVFLNTDSIPSSTEVLNLNSVSNPTEIEIVNYLTDQFIKQGVRTSDVGVISFYKKQVQLLQQKLCTFNVEVNTVDQYQGRDKSIIIVSCVRNNQGSVLSEILSDERRLNVAITRARHKLILIGSLNTLTNFVPFGKLLKCLRSDQVLTVNENSF